MSDIREIHIDWNGPYTYCEVQEMNGETDYGIYQIYGHHPAYGNSMLLYIGKAQKVTFADRKTKFIDHRIRFDKYWTSDAMHIYVGRLRGSKTPKGDEWSRQIDLTEKLLIFAHSPAWNSQELNLDYSKDKDKHKLFNVHIFNWGKHKHLLPEVSGRRYARNYPAPKDYKLYTK